MSSVYWLSPCVSKEAGTLLSAGERKRKSGLERTKRGSSFESLVVQSEFSIVVTPEDQQTAFLWERPREIEDDGV